LGDQVLLIAPVIGREHDLFGRGLAVVGDIEEISITRFKGGVMPRTVVPVFVAIPRASSWSVRLA
jgi:hypothetical protein